jgi:cell division protein FtsA
MKGKQIVAIDVGSTNVVIAVGSVDEDGVVTILGITSEPVQGVNAGSVENSETLGRAVRAAKERIENKLGIKITEAYAGLAGDFIRCVQVTDHVYVQDDQGNGCNQITERDLENLNRRMQSVKLPDDKEEIIMKEPLRFKADNKDVTEPVGAYGKVLYGTYNFILADRTMRDRLYHCLLKQEITVKKFVPNALVAHLGVATTDDIEEGAVVINLGGGVTDVTVLLNGKVQYIASIPIGMHTINADIRAYGIPNSYVEGLKVNYGSAVCDLTTDDKITFPHMRKGTTKSILRRNLARIIEERLRDICDWVRREIKEAGCGPRFSPIVLLTGGGAEMNYIEKLFIKELGYDDVRSVLPEYGFAENLGEFVTHRSYATICSLLLYGAKMGSCAVAVRATEQREPGVTPKVNTPVTPAAPVTPPAPPTPHQTPSHTETGETKGETKPTKGEPVVPPKPITPVVPDTTGGGDTINIGGDTPEQPEKQGLLGKLFGRKTTNEEQEDRWKRLREVVFGVENGNEI